ncbi:MAG: TIGR00730 family Rossman fold protein [Rhodothermales bacterium]|nr:TIGR00730 family Rossman fold protein [Rhodothermales bacterium]
MHLTVYCASSRDLPLRYTFAATRLGDAIARHGHTLVYGGGATGLMGTVARAVHQGGGRVVGIIPEALKAREGVAYDACDELIVTDTMAERKRLMFTRADAFLVLPGGIGTLEEFFEVLTLRVLGYHDKPIVLVSTDGFYRDLVAFLDRLEREGFVRAGDQTRFLIVEDPEEALVAVEALVEPPS